MAKPKEGTIDVQSRLRMFLSLDIVGSTEFKQARRGDEVLFTKIVRSPVDAMAALHALHALMKEQRRQVACTEAELAKCTYLQMPHIGCEGRHNLRGIMSGEPYPLMWAESDTENPLNNAEDRLLHRELADLPSKRHLSSL